MTTETLPTSTRKTANPQMDVICPLDGSVLSQIDIARAESVKGAIETAENAFKSWALTPVRERALALTLFKAKVEQNRDELATLVSKENGKTKGEAVDEIKRGLEVVDFASSIPNLSIDNTLEVSRGCSRRGSREMADSSHGVVTSAS